jgi:hypothetical protein
MFPSQGRAALAVARRYGRYSRYAVEWSDRVRVACESCGFACFHDIAQEGFKHQDSPD